MTKRVFLSLIFLFLFAGLLTGCASSRRLARINSEQALQRKNSINGNAVNLWPFFLAGQNYFSVLWPFIDWDSRGFSVRPFVNKEDNEWALLFPFAGVNPEKANGWCGIAYWNKNKYCGLFPLFHHSFLKYDLNFYGPVWTAGKSRGIFPLVWDSGTFSCVFPLFSVTENGIYSIPFSTKSGTDCGRWHTKAGLPGYFLEEGKKRWYNSFGIFGGGWQDFYYCPPDDPLAFYGEVLTDSRYSLLENLWRQEHKNTEPPHHWRYWDFNDYYRGVLKKDRPVQKNIWWFAFPFANYESWGECWNMQILFGLGTSIKRTPEQQLTSIPPLLCYRDTVTKDKEIFPVDRKTSDKLFTPLYQKKEAEYYEMLPEKRFLYGRVETDMLKIRPYLCMKDSIERWEKSFESTQKNTYPQPWSVNFERNGCKRKLVAENPRVFDPKTGEEAKKLLEEIKSPENYQRVNEKEWSILPFYAEKSKTFTGSTGKISATETERGVLMALIYHYREKPYSMYYHILGPLHLRDLKFAVGDIEREKWKEDFRMNLLCYRKTEERYVPTYQAKEKFGNCPELDESLQRRLSMTNPEKIRNWESSFEAMQSKSACYSIPRTTPEAEALKKEINKPEYWQKQKTEIFGIAPFFHHENGTLHQKFNIFGGLFYNAEQSETEKKLSILTPLVFHRTEHRSHPDAPQYQQNRHENFSLLLFGTAHDEFYQRKKSARPLFSEWELYSRIRMTDPERIRQWERDFAERAVLSNPMNPHPVPKTAQETAKLLKETQDIKNFSKKTYDSLTIDPFYQQKNGTGNTEKSILYDLLYCNSLTEDESFRSGKFSILNRMGYETSETVFDDHESKSKYVFFTGTESSININYKPDVSRYGLAKRIVLDEKNQKEFEQWRDQYRYSCWRENPLQDPVLPETKDEARKLLVAAQQRKEIITKENFTLLGGLYNEKTEIRVKVKSPETNILDAKKIIRSVVDKEKSTEMNILDGWLYRDKKTPKTTEFHVFRNLGYKHKTSEHIRSYPGFKSDLTKKDDKRFALLGHIFREERMIPTPEHEKAYRASNAHFHDLSSIISEDKPKQDIKKELMKFYTRWDGTQALSIPENAEEAMQLYRDIKAESGFKPEIKSGAAFYPFFSYSKKDGILEDLILPPLLSWRTPHKTCILLGLLYYSERHERKQEFLWLDQIPWHIPYKAGKKLRERFLNGDVDFYGEDDETERIALIFSRHSGHIRVWKHNAPVESIKLFHDSFRANPVSIEKWRNDELKRKEIFEKYTTVLPYYERGNFGKILFRYAEFDGDAAIWIGSGLLAKYIKEQDEENTSVLGYLYRSHKNKTESTKIFFPFIKLHEDQKKSSFSFLWRLVNVEKSASGKISGHIFFIPFGGE